MVFKNFYDRYSKAFQVKNPSELVEHVEFEDRTIYLGDIDEEAAAEVHIMVKFWNSQDRENKVPANERKPIKIFIDSGGGYITSTFTIINTIENSTTPIYTINIGTAYSGGFFIFISGHKRFAYRHSSFLYHEGSVQMGGDTNKFVNFTDFYKKQMKMLEEITLTKTSITQAEYNEHKKDDWWFTTGDGIKYNFIDKVITNLEEIYE